MLRDYFKFVLAVPTVIAAVFAPGLLYGLLIKFTLAPTEPDASYIWFAVVPAWLFGLPLLMTLCNRLDDELGPLAGFAWFVFSILPFYAVLSF